MEFLRINLLCSYQKDSKPECKTSQDIIDQNEAQHTIDFNAQSTDLPTPAELYEIGEIGIFTDHIPTKSILRKVILLRTE